MNWPCYLEICWKQRKGYSNNTYNSRGIDTNLLNTKPNIYLCLMAPGHYLNQCWLIISRVLSRLPACESTGNDSYSSQQSIWKVHIKNKTMPQGTVSKHSTVWYSFNMDFLIWNIHYRNYTSPFSCVFYEFKVWFVFYPHCETRGTILQSNDLNPLQDKGSLLEAKCQMLDNWTSSVLEGIPPLVSVTATLSIFSKSNWWIWRNWINWL